MFGAGSSQCLEPVQKTARERLGGDLVDGAFRASPRKMRDCLKGPDAGSEAAETAQDLSSDDDAKALSRCEVLGFGFKV